MVVALAYAGHRYRSKIWHFSAVQRRPEPRAESDVPCPPWPDGWVSRGRCGEAPKTQKPRVIQNATWSFVDSDRIEGMDRLVIVRSPPCGKTPHPPVHLVDC